MREPSGDEDVLVGKRDRGPAVELAHESVEMGARLPTPADGTEAPEDAGGAADALQRAEEEAVHLVVDGGDRDEGELLDVAIELVVPQWEPDRVEELAELVELSRLQRDGIP